jgi:hypothetical protein
LKEKQPSARVDRPLHVEGLAEDSLALETEAAQADELVFGEDGCAAVR